MSKAGVIFASSERQIRMITEKPRIEVGSRVRITADVEMATKTFHTGHEFTVTGSGPRGLDLVDDDGNAIAETLLIGDQIELVR